MNDARIIILFGLLFCFIATSTSLIPACTEEMKRQRIAVETQQGRAGAK